MRKKAKMGQFEGGGYQGSQKVIEFKETSGAKQKEEAEKWLEDQNRKKAILQKILESAFEKVK